MFSEYMFGGLTLGLTVLGAIFCLCPLFVLRYDGSYSTIDMALVGLERDTIGGNTSLLASFFVAIIPAADLLLDLPSKFLDNFCPDDKCPKRKSENTVARLTEIERLLFIVGIGLQSTISFLPGSLDWATVSLVHRCSNNCSTLLILAPILVFLERCTTTFTRLRTFIIAMLSTFAMVLATISIYFGSNTRTYKTLTLASGILTSCSGAIYFILILLCAFKFFREKLFIPGERHTLSYRLLNFYKSKIECEQKDRSSTNVCELYSHYIPALHMVSSFLIIFATLYVSLTPNESLAAAYKHKIYTLIFAEVIVLVIELRIRKNEIARGLIALLESKKSYVRYISHELRTPLNTAFLGLKLLTTDLRTSKNPKDTERYDTLCDVNMSCTAAVDILNDLLCYEKLESGILELHKEEIPVDSFLKESMSMFSVQAKECDVTLTIISDACRLEVSTPASSPPPPGSLVSLPVQLDDKIFADKFKMDQVIRNLISNALKFTPRGGAVTIQASFEYDPRAEIEPAPYPRRDTEMCNACPHEGRSESHAQFFRKPRKTADICTDLAIDPSEFAIHGKLVVVVTDSGAGISLENQGRLFKEIVQFSPEKLQSGGGSGLGLWITRGIVDLHEGSIRVFSEGEGKGCAFTLEIPMLRNNSAPSPRTETLMSLPSVESGDNSAGDTVVDSMEATLAIPEPLSHECEPLMTESIEMSFEPVPTAFDVLVVDDSRLNRKMLLKCLKADGHRCVEGADGLEAVEMVKERIDHANGGRGKPFDAILMDFVMPNMDGPTATKEIRALGYTGPIFGVTGNGLPTDVMHFIDCGANKVLLKPLDISTFAQAMAEIGKL